MAKRKQWPGPFQYKTDGTCVKCDKRQEYFINVSGITLGACRKHAIEVACSSEGGKTLAEATLELDEIDRERWRQRNRFTASWVPVTERLPEPDYMGNAVGVLTCLPDGEVCIGFCDNDEYGVRWQCNSTQKPTHWMPLPAPPTTNK